MCDDITDNSNSLAAVQSTNTSSYSDKPTRAGVKQADINLTKQTTAELEDFSLARQALVDIGLAGKVASELVQLAFSQWHSAAEILSLLEDIKRQSHISNLAAYAATMLRMEKYSLANNFPVAPAKPKEQQGINWAKYGPGGKYAYLTGV